MKTGLALSGGGVRASVFHLGVLARLAETDLWKTLEHISTVSGGSLVTALIFQKAGKKWPTSQEYFSTCMPDIYSTLTSYNLQKAYLLRAWYRPLEGRANIIGKLVRDNWGIESCLSELPEAHPRWTINATCYETGKNWRFHRKRMGDYIANYVVRPKFPLADAVAVSAAVPGAIGPFKLKTKSYAWTKFKDGQLTEPVEPIARALTLWDGGVYDNLGVEAIYKTGRGLRDDLDFSLISDASKPLGTIDRKWFKNIALPRAPMRLVNIPMDQVRSLRARELFTFFRANNNGGYLRMGESVEKICQNLNADLPDAQYMTPTEIKAIAEFPTTLRKLKHTEFHSLFRHGYEVCSAVLYGINQSSFSEYDQNKYTWLAS